MRNTPFVAPVKIVTFFNYLPEVFTFYWDKVPYTLQPGEKMRMENWKAEHGAIHLADRWCHLNQRDNRHSEDFFKAKMKEAVIEDGSSPVMTSGEISRLHTDLLNPVQAPAQAAPVQTAPVQTVPAMNIVQNPEAMPELALKKKILCADCGSTGPRHKKACPKKANAAVA